MARLTSQKLSNEDIHLEESKQRNDARHKPHNHKTGRKPAKSTITNKVNSRHSNNQLTCGEIENEDDEADSSAIEEQSDTADEPDALALSGARQQNLGAARRLAGLKPKDDDDMFQDMNLTDSPQALSGGEDIANITDDDDDYANVENVSDSDESEDEKDDRRVLRSAEQDLIDEFERTEQRRDANTMMDDMNEMAIEEDAALARRLSLYGTESHTDEFGMPINMNDDPYLGMTHSENLYNDMWNEAESALWRMPDSVRTREDSDPSSTTQKRVRFEVIESRESSSSGSEDPGKAFPDLFAASDDPLVRQRIDLGLEHDIGLHDAALGDNESFYDFEDEDEKLAFEVDEESDSDDDISSYDSDDEGDTTDDESREEQIARMQETKRAAGKPVDSAPNTPRPSQRAISSGTCTPSTPNRETPKNCKGPKAGTFVIDPTRATMTADSEGKKIKLLPPSKPLEKDKEFWDRARSANSSRRGSPRNSYLTMPSPGSDSVPARPFTAQSTLGSMFNGNLDILRNNDDAGIADDLFPAMMGPPQTSFTATTATDESDDDLQDVDMQDFIDMDNSDSESDVAPAAPIPSPITPNMSSSFTSEHDQNDSQHGDLLGHFDSCRGAVGSFRRNQNQARHYSSLASHPAKRASTHEYNALQKGRRGAANTPMTPARKKHASQDLSSSGAGIRKSVNSPSTSRRPGSRGNSLAGIANADLYQTLGRSPFD